MGYLYGGEAGPPCAAPASTRAYMAISKHLAHEGGTAYQLLRRGVQGTNLDVQRELLDAGSAAQGALTCLLDVVQRRTSGMDAVNASTALHLLATTSQDRSSSSSGSSSSIRTSSIVAARELLRCVVGDGAAQPRALAISAWSAAQLRVDGEALDSLGDAVVRTRGVFEGQDAANVVWAFATLRPPKHVEVLRAIATKATPLLDQFTPRHLVGIAWGLAVARVQHTEFFAAAAKAAETDKAAHFVPQDVANLLWAYAAARLKTAAPMAALTARTAVLGWDTFAPADTAVAMWAAMSIGVEDRRPATHAHVQRLLHFAARHLRQVGASGFEARHLTNAAWALARWQRHCRLHGLRQQCKAALVRPALRALAQESASRFGEFSSNELSRFLWSLGSESCLRLRVLAPGLVVDFRRPSRLAEMDSGEMMTVATALSWSLERAVWERQGVRSGRATSACHRPR